MTLKSMTGFGESAEIVDSSADNVSGQVSISVEVKSVNHRFLDVSTKLPNAYSRFEFDLTRLVRDRLRRGRVEVYVSRKQIGETAYEISFNEPLFGQLVETFRTAVKGVGVKDKDKAALLPFLSTAFNRREVLEMQSPEEDVSSEEQPLHRAVESALSALIEMRTKEGSVLEAELLELLANLDTITENIAELSKSTPVDYQAKLQTRIEKLLNEQGAEPERVAQEVAYFADRVDITEELTRLGSHTAQFRQIIQNDDGGRKMEFLLQEFGREVNTIGSKAQNSEITSLVVEAKSIIEKLREQVANIE